MIPQDVLQQEYSQPQSAVIKLIGVGGGGCNAVEQMVEADIHGVEFTCVNTDAQALAKYNPDHVIQLGNHLTRGLGAGTDPEVGRLAAEEDRDVIAAAIGNTDMLFLTAGMGGGTGTGAIPVIARIARELGVLTVAVVTKPFGFEGGKRRQVAEAGIALLREHVDSMIVVPNEKLITHLGPNVSLMDAFAASNEVLTNAVQSIAELVTNPGLINVDFADVKSVMTEMGEAMMSTGRGIGEYRARDAAIAATESPLLDEIDLKEARGILANITASADLTMGEFQIVGEILDQITADDANVVLGTVFDQKMSDEIRVTVVATGLKSTKASRPSRPTARLTQRKKPQAKKQSRFFDFGFGKTKKASAKPAEPTPAPVPAPTIREPRPQVSNEPSNRRPMMSELELRIDPVAETCSVCGNSADNHTSNCPRGRKPAPFEFNGDRVVQDASINESISDDRGTDAAQSHHSDNRHSDANAHDSSAERRHSSPDQNYNVDHLITRNQNPDQEVIHIPEKRTPVKKSPINMHVIGLFAGTAVLLSVFYIVISNGINSSSEEMSSSDLSQTNIAERKLKAANRRLTGIDE